MRSRISLSLREAAAVCGGLPFSEESLTAIKKSKTLVWDGAHNSDVSGWKVLLLEGLLKMQNVNADAFDLIAEALTFAKHLAKNTKLCECHLDRYTEKFGTQGDIRIKTSLGNKIHLYREDYILHKRLVFAEISPSRFPFTAEWGAKIKAPKRECGDGR